MIMTVPGILDEQDGLHVCHVGTAAATPVAAELPL
jgi:hypothetical protein